VPDLLEPNTSQDYIRTLTRHAIDLIGAKGLAILAVRAGKPLVRTQSRLEKWAKDPKQNLYAPDLEALAHLFYKTNFGRALRADAALPLPGVDELIDDITAAGKHDRALDVCGIYLAHHGSHKVRDHFAVRALEIKQAPQGHLTVEDWLTDKGKHAKSDGVHRSNGLANLVMDRLHVLMLRKDNSRGFHLLISDELSPDKKSRHTPAPVTKITGQVLGMTRNGHHFNRAVLLTRVSDPRATLESLQNDTTVGIKPFEHWSKQTQANLLELRNQLPEPAFPDPILDPQAMKSR
jgi:hypothetical protein